MPNNKQILLWSLKVMVLQTLENNKSDGLSSQSLAVRTLVLMSGIKAILFPVSLDKRKLQSSRDSSLYTRQLLLGLNTLRR